MHPFSEKREDIVIHRSAAVGGIVVNRQFPVP